MSFRPVVHRQATENAVNIRRGRQPHPSLFTKERSFWYAQMSADEKDSQATAKSLARIFYTKAEHRWKMAPFGNQKEHIAQLALSRLLGTFVLEHAEVTTVVLDSSDPGFRPNPEDIFLIDENMNERQAMSVIVSHQLFEALGFSFDSTNGDTFDQWFIDEERGLSVHATTNIRPTRFLAEDMALSMGSMEAAEATIHALGNVQLLPFIDANWVDSQPIS